MEVNYGLIYTVSFASHRNEACVVEIEKEGYTGVTLELTGADSPFEVDVDDDDFLYIPTRFSTTRIRVVGSDYLQQLYSTAYQQYRVTFKRNGVVTWCGFVKPELYSQDYSSENFELEIECISAMSVLEFINYKQVGESGKVFVSLWDLLKKCVESSRGKYSAVYVPHVYSRSESDYNAWGNILVHMTVSEQNFFDEDDKAMKLKDVLEEICKLLNWTCVDYLGSLYFVDADYSGEYYCYSPDMDTFVKGSVGPVLNVQRIGFSGSDHSFDLIPGYNKATVKTSNYNVGQMFPEEDFDKLRQREPYTCQKDKDVSRRITLIPEIYKTHIYRADKTGQNPNLTEITKEEIDNMLPEELNNQLGVSLIKRCEYKLIEDGGGSLKPEIINYDYDNMIQIRRAYNTTSNDLYDSVNNSYFLPFTPFIYPLVEFSNQLPVSTFSDGAIAISASVQQLDSNTLATFGGERRKGNELYIRCELSIGGKYWNGSTFKGDKQYFDLTVNFGQNNIGFSNLRETKTLDMPYNGLSGYIIPLPDGNPMRGSILFKIIGVFGPNNSRDSVYGIVIKDLKLTYQLRDGYINETEDNSDRYYENVVNEDYINELDEIEFKISSYNNDGACYSKVLLGDNYLTDNLYSAIVEKSIRPEEHLIQRIINHYSATRIKLTQVIKETSELTPLTKLSDNSMVGSIFMIAGGSIDYKMGQFRCVMVEV